MMKGAVPLLLVVLISISAVSATQVRADDGIAPYFSVKTTALQDGPLVDQTIINGPPNPPTGHALELTSVAAPDPDAVAEVNVLAVPAYSWTFGCSATAAAMIAAYYDRNGFPNIYTGPTDGGMMPPDSSAWPQWTDGNGDSYDQCPLAASRLGLDGRTTGGSIDDYWIAYGSKTKDPYITNGWTQHAWGDAIGDYMKTSQSAYKNIDGSTVFYYWSSSSAPMTCNDMATYGVASTDGTYGRKLFYEARGYAVSSCYSQKTDNNAGGFTFAMYRAEIDAGRPVMLNLQGHTVVGVGYDATSNTVYLRDTWDYDTHTMSWGGSYAGMALMSVSVVNLVCPALGDVSNPAVALDDSGRVELAWTAVPHATRYEIWHAAGEPYFIPGDDCDSPDPFGCERVDGPSIEFELPAGPAGITTYAVRAVSGCGAAPSLSAGRVGVFVYDLAPGD